MYDCSGTHGTSVANIQIFFLQNSIVLLSNSVTFYAYSVSLYTYVRYGVYRAGYLFSNWRVFQNDALGSLRNASLKMTHCEAILMRHCLSAGS